MISFILLLDGTITGTATLGQSEPGSNGNEEEHHIPQSSRTGASSDGFSFIKSMFIRRISPFCKNTVCVFYNFSLLDQLMNKYLSSLKKMKLQPLPLHYYNYKIRVKHFGIF